MILCGRNLLGIVALLGDHLTDLCLGYRVPLHALCQLGKEIRLCGRCRDGSLYTGLTNDLPRRWALHVSGRGAKYTRAHPPEAVAALWRCGDKSAAARLEYAIKAKLTHGEKLALIAEPERAAAWFPELAGAFTPAEVPEMQ